MSVVEFLKAQFENQFLTGGTLLMLLGAVLAYFRYIPRLAKNFLQRRLITTVDVSDQDEAFFWLEEWLSKHEYSQKSRLLSVSTEATAYVPGFSKEALVGPINGPYAQKRNKPKVYFTPAPGMHLLKFKGHWIWLTKTREKQEGGQHARFWREMFTLRTFQGQDYVRDLMFEAQEATVSPDEKTVGIYSHNYGNWSKIDGRMPRSEESVVLDEGMMKEILFRTEEFFTSRKWYQRLGIPYRMGFLFHGRPGNGKTSTAVALASKFDRDIYIARVDCLTDGHFRQLIASVPPHSILIIEDVDCFFQDRESNSGVPFSEPVLTFSGFLNALDGVTSSEGRLLIMTTNHINRLDEALIRPGRADHHFEFKNASQEQALELFRRFFPDELGLAVEFQIAVGRDREYSMSNLQKFLMDNRNDPTAAVRAVEKAQAA